MNFLPVWFPAFWPAAAWLPLLLLLVLTARPAARSLAGRPQAVAAACLLFALLWSLRAQLGGSSLAGMNYHLIGINLAVLMLGAPAAVWLAVLLLPAYLALYYGSAALPLTALNACVLFLPAVAANLIVRRAAAKLPANLFVYIFLNGFLAAAAGMLLTGLSVCLLLAAADAFPAPALWGKAFPVFFLLSWAEAFLSGLFTAIFVALAPQLLATFNDARYLKPDNRIWPPEP
ncbi:energy-coupling factor ABC transporter permease [Neisseria leonii]|uniref:Energy-coupling factor ABC transporter permease n=1 Tax=Neisseria leonii TaxID=2995413 RepID=A0A9X4ID92_9NEIS|nr:energy-coupling factor ABC transporter permease [Neisseria sp. 51.81]MDD9326952.1 hypothetical protein [Neisseria sp. 51.81]